MVLTDSHGISRAPYYLGYLHRLHNALQLRDSHPLWPAFQNRSPIRPHHPTSPAELAWEVPQPRPCNARRLSHMERFSLFRVRSPLLTESLLFSLPAGTEMFHFPAFPHAPYVFRCGSHNHLAALCGVSPFGHPGINARLSTPPGLSQIPTSFFGS